MQKYINSVQTLTGQAVEGATIVVTNSVGAPVTVYSDNTGTVKPTVTTDVKGMFFFYAPDGRYNLSVSGPGIYPYTISDLLIDDTLTGDITQVANITALKAISKSIYNYAETLGYYSAGIGGGSYWYDSSDTTTADNGITVIVASDGGRWKLIHNGLVNTSQGGVKGDGVTDDTTKIQAAINAISGINATLVFNSGSSYVVSSTITITDNITITTTTPEQAIFLCPSSFDNPFLIGSSSSVASSLITVNARVNTRKITVASSTGFVAGQIIGLQSNKAWYFDAREQSSVSPSGDATGTAQAGSVSTITLKAGTTYTGFVGKSVTIESGTGVGQARVIATYDDGTKIATLSDNWDTAPDNTSKYRFPQLVKGETHVIKSVVGNVIELMEPLSDGYAVVTDAYGIYKEKVTASVYTPITVNISNLYLKRTFTASTNGHGIILNKGYRCVFTNIRTDYFLVSGISVSGSYETLITLCESNGSCDTGTGYGFSVNSSHGTHLLNNVMSACRRGIDVSGTYACRKTRIEGNISKGGGTQEDGQVYGPEGTVDNFGMGSHSTSDGTEYLNNIIYSTTRGINTRGRNEILKNNKFYGNFNMCVDISYGMNIIVDGNNYYNQFDEGTTAASSNQTESSSFEATNIYNFIANSFVSIQYVYEWGRTIITNNTASSVADCFITIEYSASMPAPRDAVISNNFCRFNPNASANPVYFLTATAAITTNNFNISHNIIEASSALTTAKLFNPIVDLTPNISGAVSSISGDYTYFKLMANQTVWKVRNPYGGDRPYIELRCMDNTTNRFSGLLLISSATITSLGGSNNVSGSATVPVGTTPAAGNHALHWDGEFIYIASNFGSDTVVMLTIHPSITT